MWGLMWAIVALTAARAAAEGTADPRRLALQKVRVGDTSHTGGSYECSGFTQLHPGHNDHSSFRCEDGKCIMLAGLCNGIRNCDDGSDEAHKHCDPEALAREPLAVQTQIACERSKEHPVNFPTIAGGTWAFTKDHDCYGTDLGRLPVAPWGQPWGDEGREACARECMNHRRCVSFNYPNPGDGHCYLKHTAVHSVVLGQTCESGNFARDWDFYVLVRKNCNDTEASPSYDGTWTDEDMYGSEIFHIKGDMLKIGNMSHKMTQLAPGTFSVWHNLAEHRAQGHLKPVGDGDRPDPGDRIVWADSRVWVRMEEVEGRWTDMESYGKRIYLIRGDSLTVIGGVDSKVTREHTGRLLRGVDAKVTRGDDGRFTTELNGETLHGQLSADEDKITFTNGMAWLRYEGHGAFTGHWTDEITFGEHIYDVRGPTFRVDGGAVNMLKPLGDKAVSADLRGTTMSGQLRLGAGDGGADLVTWSEGFSWVRMQDIDGVWVDKADCSETYQIRGISLTERNSRVRSTVTMEGKGRFVVHLGNFSLRGELSAAGDELRFDRNITWTRYTGSGTFDGTWTERGRYGQVLSTICGMRISVTGHTEVGPMSLVSNDTFMVQIGEDIVQGTFSNDEIVLLDGTTWVRYEPHQDGNCFEDEITWEPLHMPNVTQPILARNASECQKRCAGTPGCAHFSFWTFGGHCYLQDAWAIPSPTRIGFVSGPFQCWDQLNHSRFTRVGKRTFLHNAFKCVELGTIYLPMMGNLTYFTEEATGKEAAKACKRRCSLVDGCEQWTMHFPMRGCELSGAGARPIRHMVNAVSGIMACVRSKAKAPTSPEPAGVDSGLIMAADIPEDMPQAHTGSLTAACGVVFFAGMTGAVATAFRRRSSTRALARHSGALAAVPRPDVEAADGLLPRDAAE